MQRPRVRDSLRIDHASSFYSLFISISNFGQGLHRDQTAYFGAERESFVDSSTHEQLRVIYALKTNHAKGKVVISLHANDSGVRK